MSLPASTGARLLIRPEHVASESIRGYVARASRYNASSPDLQVILRSLQVTTDSIQKISKLTGCSEFILREHGSLIHIGDVRQAGVLFGSSILSTDQVWLGRRFVCPKCLS